MIRSGSTWWHRVLVWGAAAGMFFGLAAEASAGETDELRGLVERVEASESYRIGVSLVHLQDDFWKGIAYGIADEAERAGVEVVQISVAGAYGNVRQQFSQLQSLQARGVDVLILGAAAFDGYNPILGQLRNEGIKVVAAGIPVNSENVDFGVAQEDFEIGRALGERACAAANGESRLAITIPGPAGAEWARLRQVGFTEAVESCGKFQVVDGPAGGEIDIGYGMSQTADLLLKNDTADFVFTPVIPMGMGAVQGARRANSDATVLSSAVVREAIPMIRDGRMVTVSEPGIVIGRLTVQYAIRELEGLEMPGLQEASDFPYSNVIVPPVLITADNVDNYPFEMWELPPRDWSIEAFQ